MWIYTRVNGTRLILDYFSVYTVPRIIFAFYLLTLGLNKVACSKLKLQVPKLPEFRNTSSNFTYSVGELAVLHCSILNLGARTVVWRKGTYPHPLTVGEMTYVPDDRFQIHHILEKGDWNLFIKNIKKEDAGMYECQISSKEKYIRRLIHLTVTEREYKVRDIKINGPRKVKKGDCLVLACNATGGKSAPHDLDWVKDNKKLVSDKSGRINITKHISYVTLNIISNLTINRVSTKDAGIYVCRTSDNMVKNVTVEITGVGMKDKDKRGTPTISQHAPATSCATSSKTVFCVFTYVAFNCSSTFRNIMILLLLVVINTVLSFNGVTLLAIR